MSDSAAFTDVFGDERGTPRWDADLPLDLSALSTEERLDLAAALTRLLQTAPEPGRPATVEVPLSPGNRPLPAGMPAVFGLCGDPKSGKDVVADHLYQTYANVARFAFSDFVIGEVNDYLAARPVPLASGELAVHRIEAHNKSLSLYRKALQAWAEARRAEDPAYWSPPVLAKARRLLAEGTQLVVITGVRFPREYDAITKLGGEVLRTIRPGNPYRADHAAERGLDHLPDSAFIDVRNEVEGDLQAFKAEIERTLTARFGG